ncbi:Flap-structured DNA-binding and RNA-binding protein [Dipsacomyces acuminosporus]|nr:Flap-structured DNA-binding and RNA-binding protein [Dipsacomyces acuminosporus]
MAPPVPPFAKAGRPASEIFFANAQHPLPEAKHVDKWFESLSQFEDMLEDMAKVSLDPVFKDELNAIDQWFSVLSEPERTAALYSLMQHCSDLQVRFFITILQQMLKMDPAYQDPNDLDNQKQTTERHSIAVQGGYSKLQTSQQHQNHQQQQQQQHGTGMRMSYDGQTGSVRSGGSMLSGSSASQRSGGWSSGNNLSSDNLLLSGAKPQHGGMHEANGGAPMVDPHAVAAAKWGLSGGGPTTPVGAEPRRTSGFVERPKSSSHEADSNPDWRVNRQSGSSAVASPSVDQFPHQQLGMAGMAPAGSRRQSNNVLGQQQQQQQQQHQTPRGSMVDMEPKDFRWSSLTDSLEPFANLGPDPSGQTLTQMLETNMNRSSGIAARRSVSNRLSIAVKSPRDTMQQLQQQQLAAGLAQQLNISGASSMHSPMAPSFGANNAGSNMSKNAQYQPRSQYHGSSNGSVGSPQMQMSYNGGVNRPRMNNAAPGSASGSAATTPMQANFPRSTGTPSVQHGNPPQSPSVAKPQDVVDFELLKDVAAWLRSLRLHKYTDCFVGMDWKEMVSLNDEQLQAKGVAALGARRKMLKVFENVQLELAKNQP